MRRITSLSSVGRAPDCSCISTKRLSRHQGVPSSSLGAGTTSIASDFIVFHAKSRGWAISITSSLLRAETLIPVDRIAHALSRATSTAIGKELRASNGPTSDIEKIRGK